MTYNVLSGTLSLYTTTSMEVSKRSIAVRGNHLTATGHHMSYAITQCYLPPGSGNFTPAKAGTRFSDPGRMLGWVHLGGGYNSQDSLPANDVSEINNQAVSWPGGEPSTPPLC